MLGARMLQGEDGTGMCRDQAPFAIPLPTQAGAFYPPQQTKQEQEFSFSSCLSSSVHPQAPQISCCSRV